jgi:uncharacterized iron-regulated membrane protein
MNGRQFTFQTSSNPLVQALSVLVFAVLLVGAVIMGAVVLAAIVGFGVIAAAVFYARMWWLKRKLRGRVPPGAGAGPQGSPARRARLIEAEYEVIEGERPGDKRRGE